MESNLDYCSYSTKLRRSILPLWLVSLRCSATSTGPPADGHSVGQSLPRLLSSFCFHRSARPSQSRRCFVLLWVAVSVQLFVLAAWVRFSSPVPDSPGVPGFHSCGSAHRLFSSHARGSPSSRICFPFSWGKQAGAAPFDFCSSFFGFCVAAGDRRTISVLLLSC
jgi:hypothetical protein